jgi:hypothetical protein
MDAGASGMRPPTAATIAKALGAKMKWRTGVLVLVLGAVLGCSPVQVSDYAEFEPKLDPQTFFDGPLTAHGVVKDRSGRVIRSFNADIEASWDGGVGTLVEDFVFDDGELQQRIWTLTPDSEGGFIGTAADVVGPGELRLAGNSIFLKYVLRIPYSDSTVDVAVDDRMYLVAPEVLINESVMSKFGVRVGSILLVIVRGDRGLLPESFLQ